MLNPRPNQSSWAASAHQKQEVVFPPHGLPRRNHGSCDQRVNKAKKDNKTTNYSLATSALLYSCYSLQRHLSYNFPAVFLYTGIILHRISLFAVEYFRSVSPRLIAYRASPLCPSPLSISNFISPTPLTFLPRRQRYLSAFRRNTLTAALTSRLPLV
jgi:hypothetical protein